jgi:hypothetical protein
MAAGGFALTATPFCRRPKGSKTLCPSIRCLTPALLRGPAAIGHPWPGAATAASLPRCPLRNACVRPLGKGQQIKIKSHSHGKIKRSQPRFTRQLLQREGCTHASHHSTGRALARLQLLILMHRTLGRPSGGSAQWATRHGCRVSRPRPWMADGGGPTEQDRSEGMPSLGEAPNERGKSPWLLGAFPSDSL